MPAGKPYIPFCNCFWPFCAGQRRGIWQAGGRYPGQTSLLANLRLRETKLKLLRKLELLIIDEVSMVRCDLLDSIDLVLRHVRKNWAQPFGGVQMILLAIFFSYRP